MRKTKRAKPIITGQLDGTFNIEFTRAVPFMLEESLRREIPLAELIRIQRIPRREIEIIWKRKQAAPTDRQQIVFHALTAVVACDWQEEQFRRLVESIKQSG